MTKQDLEDDPLEDEDFGKGIADEDDIPPDPPEEVAEAEEEPEEVEAEPEVEDTSPTLRSILAQHNVNLPDGVDEAEYTSQLVSGYLQLRQQAQQIQQQNQQYQHYLAQAQQQLAQRQAPPEPQKPPELSGLLSHWKKVPEWDDNWERLVRKDENGNLVPIPGAAPDLPQKYLDRLRWEERAQRTFFENPQQFIHEALQLHPEYQKTRQELDAMRQEFVAYQDRMLADQLVSRNLSQIKDESGQFTPAGQAYLAVVKQMEDAGITNSAFVNQIAQIAMSGYAQPAQAPAKEPVADTKKKKQLSFAKKAAEKKSNSGKPGKTRLNTREDMDRYAKSLMEEAGIDPHEVPAL